MLIGLSGACGTGKTTLTNALAKELEDRGYDVAIVEEVVRDVFKDFQKRFGYQSLEEIRASRHHFQFQFKILKNQILKENKALDEAEIVLADRTIYDNLFYTIFWNSMDWETLKSYVELFRSLSSRRYDLVFFCKPLGNNARDGFRDIDLNYVDMQDLVIRLLVDRENVVDVPNGSLERRLNFCLRYLENLLNNIL
jgi:thymidylate kinase